MSFCWGVLAQEKLCEIPYSEKKILKNKFSNSPPWSLLIEMILELFSFWTFFHFFLVFPWHKVSHILSLSKLILGNPLIWSSCETFAIVFILGWRALLCQIHLSFPRDIKHDSADISSKYKTYKFFYLDREKIIFLEDVFLTSHKLGLKIISEPLSHYWLIISRLCFKPSTYNIFYFSRVKFTYCTFTSDFTFVIVSKCDWSSILLLKGESTFSITCNVSWTISVQISWFCFCILRVGLHLTKIKA